MKWSYKTVHFELKKEGLLGGAFLDESEIEEQLNQFGRSGWELVSVIEVQNGIICFFRQPLSSVSTAYADVIDESEDEDRYENPADDDDRFVTGADADKEHEALEEDAMETEFAEPDEPVIDEFEVYEETEGDLKDPEEPEPYDNDSESVEDDWAESGDSADDPVEKRIGAIRIE